jgi:hypothetical protein
VVEVTEPDAYGDVIELGTHRGWRLWAYQEHSRARAYAIGPGQDRDSEDALFAVATSAQTAAAALRRQIDAVLAEGDGTGQVSL